MKTPCKCPGWGEYHCRDGISWGADGNEYQASPPGVTCRCYDEECCAEDLCRCAVQVPPVGTFIITDGRIMAAAVGTRGYAGPNVHLMVTEEPWEDQ